MADSLEEALMSSTGGMGGCQGKLSHEAVCQLGPQKRACMSQAVWKVLKAGISRHVMVANDNGSNILN